LERATNLKFDIALKGPFPQKLTLSCGSTGFEGKPPILIFKTSKAIIILKNK
jgi:hypothetical protein